MPRHTISAWTDPYWPATPTGYRMPSVATSEPPSPASLSVPNWGRRIGVSLRLLVVGSVFGTVAGVVIGAWGAIRQYRLSDRVMTTLALLVLSTPTFVVANLLILGALRVNWAVGIQLFDYTGETSPGVAGGVWDRLGDRLQHLILPSLTLALAAAAGFSRYQRNAMLDVLGQDFIRTARAKGLTRRRALLKHGLRTALIPMATLFAYGVAGLVTGAVSSRRSSAGTAWVNGWSAVSRLRTPTSSRQLPCSPARSCCWPVCSRT